MHSQLHVIAIIVITANSHFHLSEIKLHHITILVHQNDIIEHVMKITIKVAQQGFQASFLALSESYQPNNRLKELRMNIRM